MSRKVYVGRVSERTRERDLEVAFAKYGKIIDMNLKSGYAFIIYDDPRDAELAIRSMDGVEFDGSRLIVEASHGGGPPGSDRRAYGYGPDRERGGPPYGQGPPRREPHPHSRGPPSYSTEYRVIIEGLPPNCDWRDLKDLMRTIAPPTYADVGRNGTGIVHFDRPEEVRRIIKELHDTKFQGSRIFLKEEIVTGGGGSAPSSSRSERYHPYSRDPRDGRGDPRDLRDPRDFRDMRGRGDPRDFHRRSISPRRLSPPSRRGPPSPIRARSPSPRRPISPRGVRASPRRVSPLLPQRRSPSPRRGGRSLSPRRRGSPSPPPRRVGHSPSPRRNTP